MRTVRPSGLAFLSPVWLVAAWCELREGFRNFRADRIADIERLEAFVDEPGKAAAASMERRTAVIRGRALNGHIGRIRGDAARLVKTFYR